MRPTTPNERRLIAADIVAAVVLRKTLMDAAIELEIAIGLQHWNAVKRTLDGLRERLSER